MLAVRHSDKEQHESIFLTLTLFKDSRQARGFGLFSSWVIESISCSVKEEELRIAKLEFEQSKENSLSFQRDLLVWLVQHPNLTSIKQLSTNDKKYIIHFILANFFVQPAMPDGKKQLNLGDYKQYDSVRKSVEKLATNFVIQKSLFSTISDSPLIMSTANLSTEEVQFSEDMDLSVSWCKSSTETCQNLLQITLEKLKRDLKKLPSVASFFFPLHVLELEQLKQWIDSVGLREIDFKHVATTNIPEGTILGFIEGQCYTLEQAVCSYEPLQLIQKLNGVDDICFIVKDVAFVVPESKQNLHYTIQQDVKGFSNAIVKNGIIITSMVILENQPIIVRKDGFSKLEDIAFREPREPRDVQLQQSILQNSLIPSSAPNKGRKRSRREAAALTRLDKSLQNCDDANVTINMNPSPTTTTTTAKPSEQTDAAFASPTTTALITTALIPTTTASLSKQAAAAITTRTTDQHPIATPTTTTTTAKPSDQNDAALASASPTTHDDAFLTAALTMNDVAQIQGNQKLHDNVILVEARLTLPDDLEASLKNIFCMLGYLHLKTPFIKVHHPLLSLQENYIIATLCEKLPFKVCPTNVTTCIVTGNTDAAFHVFGKGDGIVVISLLKDGCIHYKPGSLTVLEQFNAASRLSFSACDTSLFRKQDEFITVEAETGQCLIVSDSMAIRLKVPYVVWIITSIPSGFPCSSFVGTDKEILYDVCSAKIVTASHIVDLPEVLSANEKKTENTELQNYAVWSLGDTSNRIMQNAERKQKIDDFLETKIEVIFKTIPSSDITGQHRKIDFLTDYDYNQLDGILSRCRYLKNHGILCGFNTVLTMISMMFTGKDMNELKSSYLEIVTVENIINMSKSRLFAIAIIRLIILLRHPPLLAGADDRIVNEIVIAVAAAVKLYYENLFMWNGLEEIETYVDVVTCFQLIMGTCCLEVPDFSINTGFDNNGLTRTISCTKCQFKKFCHVNDAERLFYYENHNFFLGENNESSSLQEKLNSFSFPESLPNVTCNNCSDNGDKSAEEYFSTEYNSLFFMMSVMSYDSNAKTYLTHKFRSKLRIFNKYFYLRAVLINVSSGHYKVLFIPQTGEKYEVYDDLDCRTNMTGHLSSAYTQISAEPGKTNRPALLLFEKIL